MDLTKITNIVFEDIDPTDHPDYCDAHIVSADLNGVEMTGDEIDELNEHSDFVYEKLMEHLF